MAYLGNLNGPRESEILNRLGPEYFGCSPAALEQDISFHRFAESRQEICPVHINENGKPYVEYSVSGEIKKFILEQFGYFLKGDIQVYTEDELLRWKNSGGESPVVISSTEL